MVADGDWHALGVKAGKDGWLSEKPAWIDRLIERGSADFLFWLRSDAYSAQPRITWAVAAMALISGVLLRQIVLVAFGAIVIWRYLRNLFALISHSRGGLRTRTVHALGDHFNKGVVSGLLEGDETRVALDEKVAQLLLTRFGRFEVLFFEEKDPKRWAIGLAVRPPPISAAPPDAPGS